jgi:very-short-patch-repair endonuclease
MSEGIAAVLRHALDNDGVITRSEALAIGMRSRTLDTRVAEGVLVVVAHGVYALPGALQTNRSTLRAASKALGAVVSHQAAAWMHGIAVSGPRLVVSVPHRRTHRFIDVVVHQLTDIREQDVQFIDGMGVTTPARTILDLSAVLRAAELGTVIDQLVRQSLTSLKQIGALQAELARKGKPGMIRLRRELEARAGRTRVTESLLEAKLLDIIMKGNLPIPDLQHRPPWLKATHGRVDFSYPKAKLVIEADGREWHGDEASFQRDRERDNLAQLAGWRVLRFTWADVSRRPEYVLLSIRKALELSLSS